MGAESQARRNTEPLAADHRIAARARSRPITDRQARAFAVSGHAAGQTPALLGDPNPHRLSTPSETSTGEFDSVSIVTDHADHARQGGDRPTGDATLRRQTVDRDGSAGARYRTGDHVAGDLGIMSRATGNFWIDVLPASLVTAGGMSPAFLETV
jgi:hypothetical protein